MTGSWKPPAWLDDDLMVTLGGREMVLRIMSHPAPNPDTDPVGYARRHAIAQEVSLLGRLFHEHRLIDPPPPARFYVDEVIRYAVRDRENGDKVQVGWFGIEQAFSTREEAEKQLENAESLAKALRNLGARR